MKFIILFIYSLAFALIAVSQDISDSCIKSMDQSLMSTRLDTLVKKVSDYVQKEKLEADKDFRENKYFSKDAYWSYFDSYFSLFAYERAINSEGNSAALKLEDSDTKLNINFSKKYKANIFSLATSLSVTDNTGVIFSDNTPTAGTELLFSHSFLLYKKSLSFFSEGKRKNRDQRYFVLDSLKAIYVRQLPNRIPVILHDLDSLCMKIDTLKYIVTKYPDSIELKKTLLKLYEDLEKNKGDLKRFEYLESDDEEAIDDAFEKIKKAGNQSLIDHQLNTKDVNSFYLQWLSYGASYRRDKYSTWDSTQVVFKDRISERHFNKWGLNVSYNFLWQRTNEYLEYLDPPKTRGINSVYLNGTYSLSRSNNYMDLDNLEYDVIKSSVINDTTYQISNQKKLKNISNLDFNTWWIHTFQLQQSFLFGKAQFFGLNLRQTLTLSKEQPVFDSKIGILFRFMDKEKEKSKVNFEIFLALNDFFDSKNKNKTVWERKQVGISTTVPFSKLFF